MEGGGGYTSSTCAIIVPYLFVGDAVRLRRVVSLLLSLSFFLSPSSSPWFGELLMEGGRPLLNIGSFDPSCVL